MRLENVAEENLPQSGFERLVIALLVTLIALLAFKCAWVCDDAYITLRVVDNFVNGYGLRWNVDERVQAFTHPLWLFVTSAVYGLTGEPFLTSIALGLVFSVAGVSWIALRGARDLASAVLALTALATSKAFVDFATSGLEAPLLHLALIAAWFSPGAALPPARRSLLLALASACVALTRLDGLLLVAPVVIAHVLRHHDRRCLSALALGFVPLALWELFSIVYYGFPLPNTAYAKLSTGLPALELAAQGLRYLADSAEHDLVTLPVIVLAVLVAARERERTSLCIAIGIVLHAAYVVKIGGDFMSGRFLTAPLVAAAFVLARTRIAPGAKALGACAVLALGVAHPSSPLRAPLDYADGRKPPEFIGDSGIADERGYWYGAAGLFSPTRGMTAPPYKHVTQGHGFAFKLRDEGPKLLEVNGIGYLGYFAGPTVHLVDPMGLSDAFLARQPIYDDGALLASEQNRFRERAWRIGHFQRAVPGDYLSVLADPSRRLADPVLDALLGDIRLITRAPLFAPERWRAILRRNP